MEIQKGSNNNIPWVQKYRPTTLRDLISHESILQTLRNFTDANSLPNLLFYGPPGTGKTSTIVALAKELYGEDYKKMVLQLNASDERGINVVRESIKSFAGTMTLSNNHNKSLKLIILDEADMMTSAAQFALRRIIQKYWKNTRFCLISNYVSKIIPALQSRCTRFKFKQISLDSAKQRINYIASNEGINITDSGIDAVFRLCQGDMRRVVNMLQSLSMASVTEKIHSISDNQVYQFTGNPTPATISQIFSILLECDVKTGYQRISQNQKQVSAICKSPTGYHCKQFQNNYNIESHQKAYILQRFGQLEYRLSLGCEQKIQLASLVGVFVQIRFISK